MTDPILPADGFPEPDPCDNCGVKPGAVFCCNKCLGLFCVECVTFEPGGGTKAAPADRVFCWVHAGVGGAAGHQRRMHGHEVIEGKTGPGKSVTP